MMGMWDVRSDCWFTGKDAEKQARNHGLREDDDTYLRAYASPYPSMPLCGNLGPILCRYMIGMEEWLDGSNTRLVSHSRRIDGLNTDAQHTQHAGAPFRLFAFPFTTSTLVATAEGDRPTVPWKVKGFLLWCVERGSWRAPSSSHKQQGYKRRLQTSHGWPKKNHLGALPRYSLRPKLIPVVTSLNFPANYSIDGACYWCCCCFVVSSPRWAGCIHTVDGRSILCPHWFWLSNTNPC